jgi:hypothetical protein
MGLHSAELSPCRSRGNRESSNVEALGAKLPLYQTRQSSQRLQGGKAINLKNMRASIVLGGLIAASTVGAFPLTVKVPANGIECFYGQVHTVGIQIGFSYSVQSGGAFDIDMTIRSPDGNVVERQERSREGEFGFRATHIGEYEFCFSNDMSTFSDKTVEFDIQIDSDIKAVLPPSVGDRDTERVEQYVTSLEDQANDLIRSLQYYKTRNNRNQSTVKSTEARIFYFSVFEVLLMVGMGLLQVTIVQLFFTGGEYFLNAMGYCEDANYSSKTACLKSVFIHLYL